MAPLAGDAVLFHQGYSFTNRRLFLSTLWDFWQLMAPSCVPLQALSSPKRQCPTPENIPHSWRQPTSSEGSAEGRRLLPWLPSLSAAHHIGWDFCWNCPVPSLPLPTSASHTQLHLLFQICCVVAKPHVTHGFL